MSWKKLILFLVLTIFCTNDINAQLNKPTLNSIYKYQKGKKDILGVGKGLKQMRKILNESDSLSFINQKVDSVFLMEMYDMETGISYGSIWNKRKTLNFTYYNGGKLEFVPDSPFSKYMKKLVSAWDIESIRKEEKEGNIPISPCHIYATRIIPSKKNKIDYIAFKEFYNFERDLYDQYDLKKNE